MVVQFEPGPQRAALGFKEAVLASFGFLIKEYGFRCVRTDVTFVRYEAPSVFINIYHGRGSFELGFEIGLLIKNAKSERRFSLGDIIDMVDIRRETGYTFYQVSSRDGVQEFVPKLAVLVKNYAVPALKGDQPFFQRLEEFRSKQFASYVKEMDLERIRPKVQDAWRKKNYEQVVELYESVRNYLTPLELQKLDYAKRQLSRK